MMTSDLLMALDISTFAAEAGLEGPLDPWQQEVLEAEEAKLLLACSRQAGKSTVAALMAVHEALFSPGSLTLMISPSQRQSGELFRKAMGYAHALKAELATESLLRAELANRSRIVSLPGSERTTRGYSKANLVVLDEASRVEQGLISAIRPAQATAKGARLVAMSTPAGRHPSNWFFQRWSGDDPGWRKWRVTADQVPRITPEFLEDERRELGELLWMQEYMCEFIDSETAAFPSALIERMFSDEIEPIHI